MTLRRSVIRFFSLLCPILVACGNSSAPPAGTGTGGGPSGSGTLYGIVTDIGTGSRLAGVKVSGGGKSATTDAQGTFTLTGLAAGSVNVSVASDDYAPGYATGQAGDNLQAVLVTLKKHGEKQSYDATAAMTLSQKTEAGPYALVLAPNSLETTDTQLTVAITPLDPTKEREALPGSLVTGGATSSVLLPVTFAEFSILDSAGNRVNLKSSASAQVELPIPPSLRSAYPIDTKIHCYAYDPTTGKWEDFVEGTVQISTVDGTTPVLAASVRHFSWYGGAPQGNNCVDVYVSVVSAVDGKPLANARVEASPGTVDYTDATGSALVRTTIGGTPSTYTAYQTGFDVDGSLTGMPGAKYIEFGKVTEDVVGLVQKPCSGDPVPSSGPANVRGSQGTPLVIKIGTITKLLYEATAILVAGEGAAGNATVTLQQGLPGPDGSLENPEPASGAIITITQGGGTPVTLSELAPGTGFYAAMAGLTITAGQSYLLSIDGDGNGSVDGSSRIFAVGDLAWVNPTEGATVSAANFTASWSDTGSVAGAAYAPVYEVFMTQSASGDGAVYLGTDRQFAVTSEISGQGSPLMPGAYSASLVGFSGAFSQTGGGFQTSNNITGVGVTGLFYSVSATQPTVTFTVQ